MEKERLCAFMDAILAIISSLSSVYGWSKMCLLNIWNYCNKV